jgi:hypothetical protein
MGFRINNLYRLKNKNAMYTTIKRLNEADDIQQIPGQNMPMDNMPTPPAPAATSMEEMPDFSEEPQHEPTAHTELPAADVMNLTVKELIERCNKINPLVCMGLEKFIDLNRDEILSMTTGEAPAEEPAMGGDHMEGDDDLNFSKAVEPKAPEFSLDQNDNSLDFPQA